MLAEVYRDVVLRLAPVNEAEAMAMIAEVKGARLLQGFRGRPAADIAAAGTGSVTVTTPGAVASNAEKFTVTAPATAPPITIEVTPESAVNDPNYALHAQLYGGDDHIVNVDGTLTFTFQLFGGEDNTNLQPVDGTAHVVVFC